MEAIKTYELDMNPGGVIAPVVHLSQYDSAFTLVFSLYSSAGTFTMDAGTTARIRGTKPDGNGFSADCTVDAEEKTVTVTGDVQITAAAGKSVYEITLYKDGKELNTKNFRIDVERAALDTGTVASDSKVAELYAIYDRADEIITAGEQYESYQQALEDTADLAASSATAASNSAAAAANYANDVENRIATMESTVQALSQRMAIMENDAETFVANGYVEDAEGVFENKNGDLLFTMTGIGGGSGGGSGDGGETVSTKMTFDNLSGWRSKTVATGKECLFQFNWSSKDGEIDTGPGVMKVTVGTGANAVVKTSQEKQQGDVTVDLAPYLNTGTNSVEVRITDADGNYRRAILTVTVAVISLASTFDASVRQTGAFSFASTPTGDNLQKTYYYIVDGETVGTAVTSVSGHQVSYMIPAQSHGAHSLRVYFECVINSETVRSNELYYEFIAIEPLNNTVIIASSFNQTTAQQYSTIPFTCTVYDPANPEPIVSYYANNTLLSTQTIDRTEQSYPYRVDEYGTLNFRIQCGATSKTLTVTVEETEIDVHAVTENLVLHLDALGRSNNEAGPGTWVSTAGGSTVSAALSNFNYTSDGWGTDSDGNQRLRVTGDARAVIPFKAFANDPRPGGLTLSIDFATSDVIDYTTPIISCMNGGRGFEITPESAALHSNESQIGAQYKEDVHLRLDIVISKRENGRLLKVYTDGVECGSTVYPDGDLFVQGTPADISIGSNLCTVDIYSIRVYDNDLTSDQLVDNWIADTQDGALMLDRYSRNNVYAGSKITPEKLPATIPYMIIRCEELPQAKGDKKQAVITFIDPLHPARSFISRVELDVQGTSSQKYPRKNYKSKSKEGFESVSTGTVSSKWAMDEDAIPAKTFTFKKDYASSEGANNTVLAMLFNEINPYRTLAQRENAKVRQSIQGFPMVIFWEHSVNTGTETTTVTEFIGKYNFNNDKGTEEVFGFVDGDEVWEVCNNNSQRCLCKKTGFDEMGVDEYGNAILDWYKDFEARYPDEDPEYRDSTQLEAFLDWIKSTDSTAATNNDLAQPVTYTTVVTTYIQVVDSETGAIDYREARTQEDITFTKDTAEYRIAKFRDEAPQYIEMTALHFYSNFCEVFLGLDSLAKNNMFAFIGDAVNSEDENVEEGAA